MDSILEKLEKNRLELEKRFGKGSVMKMSDKPIESIPVISSGDIGLDIALGVGGYPRGRVVEIYGPESSGKTTLALHAIAEAQKLGGICAFIDAEHALDPVYAQNLGVVVDNLWVSQPDCGEEALEIAESFIDTGVIDVIVIDSVAALTPKAEIEGEMGDSHMGLQARLMSQALRKLTAKLAKSKTCLIFINQIRMKIGVMFGSPETTTGGNALKFYATQRLDVRKKETNTEKIDGEDSAISNLVKVKVVKNKVAPPFREVMLTIKFGKGIDGYSSLLDLCIKCNLIEKSGSWFSYKEEKIGQGKEKALDFIKSRPDLIDDFVKIIKTNYLIRTVDAQDKTTAPERPKKKSKENSEELVIE